MFIVIIIAIIIIIVPSSIMFIKTCYGYNSPSQGVPVSRWICSCVNDGKHWVPRLSCLTGNKNCLAVPRPCSLTRNKKCQLLPCGATLVMWQETRGASYWPAVPRLCSLTETRTANFYPVVPRLCYITGNKKCQLLTYGATLVFSNKKQEVPSVILWCQACVI